jgi:hypothetical protein
MQVFAFESRNQIDLGLLVELCICTKKDGGFRTEIFQNDDNEIVIELYNKSLSNVVPANISKYKIAS